jgi:hypothetical protein
MGGMMSTEKQLLFQHLCSHTLDYLLCQCHIAKLSHVCGAQLISSQNSSRTKLVYLRQRSNIASCAVTETLFFSSLARQHTGQQHANIPIPII